MKTSCGILFKHGDDYLICRSSGRKKNPIWGIPKGNQEAGEREIETAIRETYEETGIVVTEADLTPFLRYSTPKKNIVVFLCELTERPPVLNCVSMLPDGRPEIDGYRWVSQTTAAEMINNHMKQIFL